MFLYIFIDLLYFSGDHDSDTEFIAEVAREGNLHTDNYKYHGVKSNGPGMGVKSEDFEHVGSEHQGGCFRILLQWGFVVMA